MDQAEKYFRDADLARIRELEAELAALRQQQGEPFGVLDLRENLKASEYEQITKVPPGRYLLYREAAPRVPEGWKLVPVEPVKPANVLTPFWEQAMRGYRFVLASAPEPKE